MDKDMLTQRALELIPRGSHTMSKSLFFEDRFPDYPKHVIGGDKATLIGVDQKQYLDFICALGSVGLGYGVGVDSVLDMLRGGVSFSVSHSLEVELAEILTSMIPFAEQVRLVKTGSEACQGAVRAARIATGREKVVVSGYHGWHDWYAAWGEDSPGITQANKDNVTRIQEYNIVALRNALEEGDVACFMLEPCRDYEPIDGFLEQARALCDHYGTLMIFDEMLTGFRWSLQGGSDFFQIVPDLAVYGKAMGNGFPISAIVGPKKYMEHTWPVSGTFSGDLCGIAAAIRNIQYYMMHPVIQHMWTIGGIMRDQMNIVLNQNGAYGRMRVCGYNPHLWFDGEPTFIDVVVNAMAKRGVLVHPRGINFMFSHTEEDINQALGVLHDTLKEVA